jgi:hypothetical protein
LLFAELPAGGIEELDVEVLIGCASAAGIFLDASPDEVDSMLEAFWDAILVGRGELEGSLGPSESTSIRSSAKGLAEPSATIFSLPDRLPVSGVSFRSEKSPGWAEVSMADLRLVSLRRRERLVIQKSSGMA